MIPDWRYILALAVAVAGFFGGIRWQQGADAIALKGAYEAAQHLAKAADEKGIEHASTVDKLNSQLVAARGKLYDLTTGRTCLGADAVRLLNSIGDVPAAASEPASAPAAVATDRDVGAAIATCRSGYARLADQLNTILDIEDGRQNQR